MTVLRIHKGNITYERDGDFLFPDEKLVGAWARVNFKHRGTPMFKRLRREVFDKGYSQWSKNPAGMIVKCAEADALRSSFPTLLGGMYIEGEMQTSDVRPVIQMPRAIPQSPVDLTAEVVEEQKKRTRGPNKPKPEEPPPAQSEIEPKECANKDCPKLFTQGSGVYVGEIGECCGDECAEIVGAEASKE